MGWDGVEEEHPLIERIGEGAHGDLGGLGGATIGILLGRFLSLGRCRRFRRRRLLGRRRGLGPTGCQPEDQPQGQQEYR
ncbi:MAG: hypothetical protein U9R72_10825 [Chloroflexota bacterium]|nr:hypothetical protein [Chloroflexota bacterium]